MAETNAQRKAKLPKWAQREMERLENNARWHKERLEAIGNPSLDLADPQVLVDPYITSVRFGSVRGRIPVVQFSFGAGWNEHIEARMDERARRVELTGGARLAVYPRSSNSITLGLDG